MSIQTTTVTLKNHSKQSPAFNSNIYLLPSQCKRWVHPVATQEVGVEFSQVTCFAKCAGAKRLRTTASATWLQSCCRLWCSCSCSSVSVREVSCIRDTELEIATLVLSVVQMTPSVLCRSSAEEIHCDEVPSESEGEALRWVFPRRLQLRS